MAGAAPDDHRANDLDLRVAVLEAQMREVQQWKEQARGAWALAKLSAAISAGAWALAMWAKDHLQP